MRLYDSHIHLDEMAQPEPPQQASHYAALVPGIVPGRTEQRLDNLLQAGQRVGLGLHPWYIGEAEPEGPSWQAQADLSADPRISAIGETGLDHLKLRDDKARQRAARWFEAQVRLASDLNKPLVVHCVRAHGACLEILRRVRPKAGGAIHAFSGSLEVMRAYERLGFRIGIGAAVTRERSLRVRQAAKAAPSHQLLIETDAPYLAVDGNPQGFASDLYRIAEVVAELRGLAVEAVAEQTWQNAHALFGKATKA